MRGTSVRQGGFTSVEMVAAMVGAAVLALTAGAMLFYGYVGWQRARQSVDIQRDMTVSMTAFAAALRPATNVTASGSTLTVTRQDSSSLSFSSSGSNLVYDPNIAAGNDQLSIVNGSLVTFAPAIVSNGVSIVLVVGSGMDMMSNNVYFARRN